MRRGLQGARTQKPPFRSGLVARSGLTHDPVRPIPRSLSVRLDLRPSFLITGPLTNPRMLWFCQSVAFAISAGVSSIR